MNPSNFLFASWLFLKALGVIYLIAFASFGVQAMGLIGSQGILPVRDLKQRMEDAYGSWDLLRRPSILGINSSDLMIRAVVISGAVCSLLLIAGVIPRLMLILLFVLYLSIVNAGQVFMSFQWDILLLEAGFLAIFLFSQFNIAVWLLWWLLFRLMFLSGAVKIKSGDESWKDLTALTFHYETQPLPTFIGWFAHQLPAWFQKGSTALMFVVELAIPFLIFVPGDLRLLAGVSILVFQLLIFATGNYTFFNLLTIALVLLLIGDPYWTNVFSPSFVEYIREGVKTYGFGFPVPAVDIGMPILLGKVIVVVTAAIYVALSLVQLIYVFSSGFFTSWIRKAMRAVRPFHIVNNYGLFAVMTKERPEIIIEGSKDGESWLPYRFRYKPGDLNRAPTWAQPHQPRLDWQMWFAALGDYRRNPWTVNFILRLLDGSTYVLDLLKHNPFPESPPRYIRARLFEYKYTDLEEWRNTGKWWKRKIKGTYLPPISRDEN